MHGSFFPSLYLCIHGTLHSNLLSFYFTYAWYLVLSHMRRNPFPSFRRLVSMNKDTKDKKKKRKRRWKWFGPSKTLDFWWRKGFLYIVTSYTNIAAERKKSKSTDSDTMRGSLLFMPLISGLFCPLPQVLQLQWERCDYSNLCRNKQSFTHKPEIRRFLPPGLTVKQIHKTAIVWRCSFCPFSRSKWSDLIFSSFLGEMLFLFSYFN